VFDRKKTLSNIPPKASVDQRNTPIGRSFTDNLDLGAKVGDYAVIAVDDSIVQKETLDNICFIPKA
jgi:hypothetical protein